QLVIRAARDAGSHGPTVGRTDGIGVGDATGAWEATAAADAGALVGGGIEGDAPTPEDGPDRPRTNAPRATTTMTSVAAVKVATGIPCFMVLLRAGEAGRGAAEDTAVNSSRSWLTRSLGI